MTNSIAQNLDAAINIDLASTVAGVLPNAISSISECASAFIIRPTKTKHKPKVFRGADADKFFAIDVRIAAEALRIGYLLGRPTEALGSYVALSRGAADVIGRLTRWSRKALKNYTGIRLEIAKVIQDAFIKHGLIGPPVKMEGKTWYEVRSWSQFSGVAETADETKLHQALLARTFVDGVRKGGEGIDRKSFGLLRLMTDGMKGNLRADNSDSLALLIAMHTYGSLCRDATGGVPASALWRPFGKPELLAAAGNRRAYAFDRVSGNYETDKASRFGRAADLLLSATAGNLESAMFKLNRLAYVEPVIVAMHKGQPCFYMTRSTAEELSAETAGYILPPDDFKRSSMLSDIGESVESELVGKLVVPTNINDAIELREAYIPAFMADTSLMRKLRRRFDKQNRQPSDSLDAIDELGGLKMVTSFLHGVLG